jgi:hypothetical protein
MRLTLSGLEKLEVHKTPQNEPLNGQPKKVKYYTAYSPRGRSVTISSGGKDSQWLTQEIEALKAEGPYETADLLTRLAARHPVRIKYFTGHWMDVDTLADLADARNFT